MTAPQSNIIGTATSYENLRKLIAARRQELGLSQIAVDEIAGVQTGYTGKIECGSRHFGDMSLGAVLGALGISLAVMRSTSADENRDDISKTSVEKLKIDRKKRGAKGGRATARKLSPEKRRAAARHASLSRWRDWRRVKAEKERKAKRAAKTAQDDSAATE